MREVFESTVSGLFPRIEVVMALSLAQEGVTKETLHINSLVMKIFNLSTLSSLPAYFCGSEESLLKWTSFGRRALLAPAEVRWEG